jgi:hypothetical protein
MKRLRRDEFAAWSAWHGAAFAGSAAGVSRCVGVSERAGVTVSGGDGRGGQPALDASA